MKLFWLAIKPTVSRQAWPLCAAEPKMSHPNIAPFHLSSPYEFASSQKVLLCCGRPSDGWKPWITPFLSDTITALRVCKHTICDSPVSWQPSMSLWPLSLCRGSFLACHKISYSLLEWKCFNVLIASGIGQSLAGVKPKNERKRRSLSQAHRSLGLPSDTFVNCSLLRNEPLSTPFLFNSPPAHPSCWMRILRHLVYRKLRKNLTGHPHWLATS